MVQHPFLLNSFCQSHFLRFFVLFNLLTMSDNLMWVSAQIAHPLKPDVTVQMWWQEEREPGVRRELSTPFCVHHRARGFQRNPQAEQSWLGLFIGGRIL